MRMGKNVRRFIALQVPIRIRVPHDRTPTWTAERRLRVALANNNRAHWYACQSQRTVADIERKFWEGSVGRLLYDVTGGVLGDLRKLGYIFMQLSRTDADVLTCLRELSVEPIGPVSFHEAIKHP